MNEILNFFFPQALGVFGLCQIFAFIEYVRARLSKEYFETLLKAVLLTVASAVIAIGVILSITGEFSYKNNVFKWKTNLFSIFSFSRNVPL